MEAGSRPAGRPYLVRLVSRLLRAVGDDKEADAAEKKDDMSPTLVKRRSLSEGERNPRDFVISTKWEGGRAVKGRGKVTPLPGRKYSSLCVWHVPPRDAMHRRVPY